MIALLLACVAENEVPPTPVCDAPSTADHPRDAEYQAVLQQFYDDNAMPGAVVGVHRGGEAPWVGALGEANLTHGSPMAACTRFRTGSISKLAVAALVVQQAEQGAFELDDAVVDSLPELRGEIEGIESVTVRQLLNHTSGLGHPSEDDLGYQLSLFDDPESAASRPYADKLADHVYGDPLLFEPGADSSYSNAGFWVLARLLEVHTGQSFDEALDERLFAPHGLTSTRFAFGDDPTLARGYSPMDGGLADTTLWDRADSDGDPAGGLGSDAADLLALVRLLFDGSVVSPESLAEMLVTPSFPSCPDGDCGYGLGIESLTAYSLPAYGKNGSLPGVDANVYYFPDADLALVAFASWGAGNHKDAFEALLHD